MALDVIKLIDIKWYDVLNRFGLRIGDRPWAKPGTCPICHKLNSFRFTNYQAEGDWICKNCGAGKGVRLVKDALGLSAAQFFEEVRSDGVYARSIGAPIVIEKEFSPRKVAINLSKIKTVEQKMIPVRRGDGVFTYLTTRVPGLDVTRLSGLSFVKSLEFFEEIETDGKKRSISRGFFPAMIAKVVDCDGNRVTLHRTFLSRSAKQKAPFENVKMQMGGVRKLNGDHIPLVTNPASRVLAVGEGIEGMATVAVAHDYTINVWSMLNAGNLAKAAISRDLFDVVIIYADFDKVNKATGKRTGTAKAEELKLRLLEHGFEVVIYYVHMGEDTDCCDVWVHCWNRLGNFLNRLRSKRLASNSYNPFRILSEMMDDQV